MRLLPISEFRSSLSKLLTPRNHALSASATAFGKRIECAGARYTNFIKARRPENLRKQAENAGVLWIRHRRYRPAFRYKK
jgi:hypothetical protein